MPLPSVAGFTQDELQRANEIMVAHFGFLDVNRPEQAAVLGAVRNLVSEGIASDLIVAELTTRLGEAPPTPQVERVAQALGDISPEPEPTDGTGVSDVLGDSVSASLRSWTDTLRSTAAATFLTMMEDASTIQDPEERNIAFTEAGAAAFEIASAASKLSGLFEQGNTVLNDGTLLDLETFKNADPLQALQLTTDLARMLTETLGEEGANGALVALGLPPIDIAGLASSQEAQRRAQQKFQNDLATFGARLDVEDVTTRRQGVQLERSIRGLAESRERADFITSSLLALTPFQTSGGKKAFTGADLGAAVTQLAAFAGIQDPETTPLIQFPGTTTIDPRQELAAQTGQLGVAGPLQQFPNVNVGAVPVAGAPPIVSQQAGPTLQRTGSGPLSGVAIAGIPQGSPRGSRGIFEEEEFGA